MPTPYERYVKGWKRAEEEMTRRKQLGFQERGLGFEERRVGLGERRFEHEEDKWDVMGPLYEARTEELGREEQPTNPFLDWRSRNPDAPVSDWIELNRKGLGDERTAYEKNLELQEKNRMDFMRLSTKFGERKMFDEHGMFLGSPQDRVDFNKYKVLERQFGEKAKETKIPKADVTPITALDKLARETEDPRARRNAQMLRSKLMRAQHEAQGIPYDTSEEDNLLAVLRGKNVDWVKAEAENPDLDWGYIWEQLGTK